MKLLTLTLMFTAALSAGPITVVARCSTYEACAAQFTPPAVVTSPLPSWFDHAAAVNSIAQAFPGGGAFDLPTVEVIGHDNGGDVFLNVRLTETFEYEALAFIATPDGGVSLLHAPSDPEFLPRPRFFTGVNGAGYAWGYTGGDNLPAFILSPIVSRLDPTMYYFDQFAFVTVFSVNDQGQALVEAFNPNDSDTGAARFFVVNTPTPEPSTWFLAGAGLAVLGWRRSRSKSRQHALNG